MIPIANTPPPALADPSDWGHMDGWGWGMAVFGWLLLTLMVVLVAWVVWAAARRSGGTPTLIGTALEVLDERYARGEIDRKDYLQRKGDLQE